MRAGGHSIPVPIHRHREGTVNATTITLARLRAVKVVKRQMQAQGLKPAQIAGRIIVAAATPISANIRSHAIVKKCFWPLLRSGPSFATPALRAGSSG